MTTERSAQNNSALEGNETARSNVQDGMSTKGFIVPEDLVSTIWESAEPNAHVQQVLVNWL